MLYHLAALWMAFVIFAAIFASDDPKHREFWFLGSVRRQGAK
jgi:hypothetical protein